MNKPEIGISTIVAQLFEGYNCHDWLLATATSRVHLYKNRMLRNLPGVKRAFKIFSSPVNKFDCFLSNGSRIPIKVPNELNIIVPQDFDPDSLVGVLNGRPRTFLHQFAGGILRVVSFDLDDVIRHY